MATLFVEANWALAGEVQFGSTPIMPSLLPDINHFLALVEVDINAGQRENALARLEYLIHALDGGVASLCELAQTVPAYRHERNGYCTLHGFALAVCEALERNNLCLAGQRLQESRVVCRSLLAGAAAQEAMTSKDPCSGASC